MVKVRDQVADGASCGMALWAERVLRIGVSISGTQTENMKKQFYTPYLLLAFAVVGIAVAFYDAYQLYNGQALWCPPPINGCNEVANSPYARIYNLPVGYFGVVYYLYMFGLAALLAFDPFSRGLRFAALAYTALGVCFSIYFMYLQVAVIGAICFWCAVAALLDLLIWLSALVNWRLRRTPI